MSDRSTSEARTSASPALAGKYMTFKLGREDYGLQILKVRELIGLMDITRVPGTPESVRGVINLRGKVIPVVDLREKFGMGRTQATDQTVIVVVQLGAALTLGVLVDEVLEVLDLPATHIEPPPALGTASFDLDFILGIGKADKRVVFLLDIDRVLSASERAAVSTAAAA